jgi:hypothetical protein
MAAGRRALAIPEIIGSIRSTYTRAICMVCEEKKIEYTLTEKLLHAPEIFAIHPFGKMPVLRHGDVALFESKAGLALRFAMQTIRTSASLDDIHRNTKLADLP